VSTATGQVSVFAFPLPENMGNHRVHWATKHRRRKAYLESLDTRSLLKWNPRPPSKPWEKAHAEVEVRTYRQMDQDNATARVKWCLDWLVSRGYLVDDKPKHLTLSVTSATAPRAECGVTLRLTELHP